MRRRGLLAALAVTSVASLAAIVAPALAQPTASQLLAVTAGRTKVAP